MMSDPLTIDINSEYIQQLYKERDEALARNRELEQQLEARIFFVKNIASNLNSVEAERDELFNKIQILEEERAGLECCYDVERKAHTACIAENDHLRILVSDLQSGLQDCWDNEYSLEELQALRMRVKEMLS